MMQNNRNRQRQGQPQRRIQSGSNQSRSQAPITHQYLIFNKPYDVLCQFTDREGDRATLKDYIPVPDVYPVGRLDRDSEGLLLLTNNGALQHRLINPRFAHPRTYWVQIERIPSEADLDLLRTGLEIQGERTRPAEVRRLATDPELPPRVPPIRDRKSVPTCWLEMVLREGRNRQVRRMTAAIGFPTLRLVRVAIGPLQLGELAPGEWRSLSLAEQESLIAFSFG